MGITEHNLGKVVGPPGNLNDSTATFTQAATRENINTGEKGSTIFGKIKRWLADMKSAAFAELTQSLAVTAAGYAMDARAGKTLDTKIAKNASDITSLNADYDYVEEWLGKTGDAVNDVYYELKGQIGNCKFVDTGYVKDSVNIVIPEGTTAIVIVAGALYLVRSLSTNMLKDLIGGTESASYVIHTAPSSRRFYADAATAGDTCRISAILFKD